MAKNGNQPLVSIVIVNYKRRAALALAIDSVLKQDYLRRELIVVDNHSEEDVEGLLNSRRSAIKFVPLKDNLGACGGRNAGIREACGDIIVTLDSDVSFVTESELTAVVRTFAENQDFHVLAFQVCEPDTGKLRVREWCHPRNLKEYGYTSFETDYFVEGAVAYRREVLDIAGLYYDPLFVYGEGWDLGLRIMDHGFRILYAPQVKAAHLMAPEGRVKGIHRLSTRNYVWIAYKDLPVFSGLRFVLPKLATILFFSARFGKIGAFARGFWEGIKGLERIRADRAPVRRSTLKYIARLERNRPNVITRLAQKGMTQL